MCYRDNVPPLILNNIHVACLCGDNGSGKSTIFDAMTWALWGKCRASTIDELLYIGQNEMEVELEFMSGERLFRVIRKFSRSSTQKTSKSTLDLQAFDGSTFRSIGEQSIIETQKKIVNLLHLDYITFINSALLLQGRANEFSNKTPPQRKEILASILDLDFYSEIERQAKIMAERKKGEEENLSREIAAILQKIDEKPALEADAKRIQTDLQELRRTLADNEITMGILRQQKEMLMAKEENANQLMQHLSTRNTELQNQRLRFADLNKEIETYNKTIAEKQAIEAGYAQLKASNTAIERYNDLLAKASAIQSSKHKLQDIITSSLNILLSEKKLQSQQVRDLQVKASRIQELNDKLASLRARQSEIEVTGAELELHRKLHTDKSTQIGSLSASIKEFSIAVQDINARLDLISHAGATCPLCESELGPEGHITIENKLKAELSQKTTHQNAYNTQVTQLRKELSELDNQLKQKEPVYKAERDSLNRQIVLIERELKDAQSAVDELPSKTARLTQIDIDIRDKKYATDQQTALSRLDVEEAALGYNQASHEAEKQKRSSLLHFEESHAVLLQAESKLSAQQAASDHAKAEILRLENIINRAQIDLTNLTQEVSCLPDVTEQLSKLEAQRATMQKQERETADKLAALLEKTRQIAEISENKLEKEAQIKQLREDNTLYGELALAFSKKGIQAVLIEESLPEIAEEANTLLAKMTDNRMSISIESQKDNKKGGLVETLEIRIADELGTRNYEMFSGGEAFRIDLALRIAISRLLVRRAGASLPLLIIDEGFGTQDSTGLEKLIEAINSIQDDFEKIFMVTHLEELKDRFPVVINVRKTHAGSMISISE